MNQKNWKQRLALVGAFALMAAPAFAQSDAASIVTNATTTWSAVATLLVTIGTFLVAYRLVRKVG